MARQRTSGVRLGEERGVVHGWRICIFDVNRGKTDLVGRITKGGKEESDVN